MSAFEIIFYKTIDGAERSYTISHTVNQSVISRKFTHYENQPKLLELVLEVVPEPASANILSSSFSGWSNGKSGAIDIGTRVQYSLYPTSTNAKTTVMYGVVSAVEPREDGTVEIKAVDYLSRFANKKLSRICFSDYRDRVLASTGVANVSGLLYLSITCTDSDIVQPPTSVELAVDDILIASETECQNVNADYYLLDSATKKVAQPFTCDGDACFSSAIHYEGLMAPNSNTADLRLGIQKDNGSGSPDGTYLFSMVLVTTNARRYTEVSHVSSNAPRTMEPGATYWFVVEPAGDTTVVNIRIFYDTTGPYSCHGYGNPNLIQWKDYNGSSWTAHNSQNLDCHIGVSTYRKIPTEDLVFDASNYRFIVMKLPGEIRPASPAVSFYRGRLSYYRGSISVNAAISYLVGQDTFFMLQNSAANLNTIPMYRTLGRSLLGCLQELADLPMSDGRLGALYHYFARGNHYVSYGSRYNSSDSSAFTFAHGKDTTNDNEIRIIRVNLEKKTKDRYGKVTVVGSGPNNESIVATLDDASLSDSYFVKTTLEPSITVHDASLSTYESVVAEAKRVLKSTKLDEYEGSIVVSGVYPDAMELNTSSEYLGSGKNITLKYSPIGISTLKLRVTGVICAEDETEIFVSNPSPVLTDALNVTRQRIAQNEAFTSPDDPYTSIYQHVYVAEAKTSGSRYMELQTSSGTPINNHRRVLCVRTDHEDLNRTVYRAEFSMQNGYCSSGGTSDGIAKIVLYDSSTGGTAKHTWTAPDSAQYLYKWKTVGMIVEFAVKYA